MSLLQKALLILILPLQLAQAQPSGYDIKSIRELNDRAYALMLDYKFKESLSLAREALKRGIYIRDNEQISAAYNTIAGNFEELSENDKAIANYNKALAYAGRTANDRRLLQEVASRNRHVRSPAGECILLSPASLRSGHRFALANGTTRTGAGLSVGLLIELLDRFHRRRTRLLQPR